MAVYHLDDKKMLSSEKMNHSTFDTARKTWQTPKLSEIDYGRTSEGSSGADDGFFGYS